MRMRFRKLLVLVPLLITWIVFQSMHYNRRISKLPKNKTRNFTFKRLLSPSEHRLKLVHKNYDWMTQSLHERNINGSNFKNAQQSEHKTDNLWFMKDGTMRPGQMNISVENLLWPEQSSSDRIIEQLMYVPRSHSNKITAAPLLAMSNMHDRQKTKNKKILLIGDFDRNKLVSGKNIFRQEMCPVNTCTLVSTLEEARNNDAVIFKEHYISGIDFFIRRRPQNIWILYLLESPLNLGVQGIPEHTINWTASYRRNSDIVTPYGKFVPYNEISTYIPGNITLKRKMVNYAANKTKQVAWFVSNCNAKNDRFLYAKSLSKYINVDVYGNCGTLKCPREKHGECLAMLERDYKFYLSFENSNCKNYITEKFFEYGLRRNILPIVMGPQRQDYAEVAPPHSFIHVNDFATPKDLADFLHVLDNNNTLYNEYFAWQGTGEFIDTHFWCRLCAMLHAPRKPKSYKDLQEWWAGPGVCQSY